MPTLLLGVVCRVSTMDDTNVCQLSCVAAVGAHAAIMRELGRPLAFPGNVALAKQACDVRVLASAFEWAGSASADPAKAKAAAAAKNTAFNITNGDTMVWTALYPRIAELFGMASTEIPEPMELAKEMPRYEYMRASNSTRLAA
jgi:hypothetical protein